MKETANNVLNLTQMEEDEKVANSIYSFILHRLCSLSVFSKKKKTKSEKRENLKFVLPVRFLISTNEKEI